jgi:hypothetical protein
MVCHQFISSTSTTTFACLPGVCKKIITMVRHTLMLFQELWTTASRRQSFLLSLVPRRSKSGPTYLSRSIPFNRLHRFALSRSRLFLRHSNLLYSSTAIVPVRLSFRAASPSAGALVLVQAAGIPCAFIQHGLEWQSDSGCTVNIPVHTDTGKTNTGICASWRSGLQMSLLARATHHVIAPRHFTESKAFLFFLF